MTVNEIIKAQEICFLRQSSDCANYCKDCPVMEHKEPQNCQIFLAENTIKKLNELTQLLDDKVNHHYYDSLEFYQEENTKLRFKLDTIKEIVDSQ